MDIEEQTITRREALRRTAYLVVLGAAPAVVAACSSKELVCDDVSTLSTADKQLRASLAYADKSPLGEEKNCSNCQFFTSAGDDKCGSCTLIKGPINPKGHCDSWAAKQV